LTAKFDSGRISQIDKMSTDVNIQHKLTSQTDTLINAYN